MIDLAVISGSGFYDFPGLDEEESRIVKTHYGDASIMTGKIEEKNIAFLTRHGKDHSILPNMINYRANLAALKDLEVVDGSGKNPLLEKCEILAACDVKNPLCGPNGASRIYGPQKGADAEAVRLLDEALRRCGEAIEAQLGAAVLDLQGGGAAGGLGAGLVGFAGGHLRPGVEIVAEACGLAERIRGADLVLTGEGRLDGQSAEGKTPVGVARIARDLGVPVVALAGALGEGYEKCYAEGITAAFSICSRPMSLDEAIAEAENLLAQAAEGIVRRFG